MDWDRRTKAVLMGFIVIVTVGFMVQGLQLASEIERRAELENGMEILAERYWNLHIRLERMKKAPEMGEPKQRNCLCGSPEGNYSSLRPCRKPSEASCCVRPKASAMLSTSRPASADHSVASIFSPLELSSAVAYWYHSAILRARDEMSMNSPKYLVTEEKPMIDYLLSLVSSSPEPMAQA